MNAGPAIGIDDTSAGNVPDTKARRDARLRAGIDHGGNVQPVTQHGLHRAVSTVIVGIDDDLLAGFG